MPLMEITGLTHSFGGLKALSSFELAVDPDAVWGIIGPNGAGKTTVFNLITGVYKPDGGRVSLHGENITGLPSHRVVEKGISRTFQNIRLFKSMTVLDNVRTGAYATVRYPLVAAFLRTKAFSSAEAGITNRARALLADLGLGDREHDSAAALPYGLQRKVELARALVSGPSVLLLDEPGAGMNPSELEGLAGLIAGVRRSYGVAVVLIEHRMQLVHALCRRVKVLNFGETIFNGEPAGLAESRAVVQAYFGETYEPPHH